MSDPSSTLSPGDVIRPPAGCCIEMHNKGQLGIVRRLEADGRPPKRLTAKSAIWLSIADYNHRNQVRQDSRVVEACELPGLP
jgi:hypothetical protein